MKVAGFALTFLPALCVTSSLAAQAAPRVTTTLCPRAHGARSRPKGCVGRLVLGRHDGAPPCVGPRARRHECWRSKLAVAQ